MKLSLHPIQLGACVAAALCLPAASVSAQSTNLPARAKAEYERFALLREGDAALGKKLFNDETKVTCARCHTVDGAGGRAGPDLQAAGDRFGRREIIDAILSPSAFITEGYTTTIVETRAGADYTGVIKQTTADGLELMGADGKLVRVALADIKSRRVSDVSLMPENLQAGLSLEEFNGVVEYLVSLKTPASASLVQYGMPAAIPKIAQPITMQPFHAEGLRFEHPVWFNQVPGLSNAFYVVEHESGKILLFEKKPEGDVKTVFAELGVFQKGTRGFLGMALHAKFRENRKYYTAKQFDENGKYTTLVYEREAAADFRHDSGKPPRLILRLDEGSNVHYGGGMVFGPDGYLYVGMGDGGPQEDPFGNGQNLNTLLAKMLRIDMDHTDPGLPYAIPRDNPFVGRPGVRPEIWAYGFREPWRFSFDPLTKELWVGDVGQDRYEEVDIVRPGENYGWNVFEGFERFSNKYRREGEKFVPPVFAYNRRYGDCVTGGFVCRADPHSPFYGMYIFGDYDSKRIFAMTQENRMLKKIAQIGTCPERVTSFGTDEAGHFYICGYEGTIYLLDLTAARID